MNAPAKINGNLAIWNALGRTDPAHTKQFKRSGGFSGTALKPIWVERQLTEVFGPCGEGWGTDEPRFEMVTVGDEVLVYCTVRCWHTDPSKSLWGVGGDKVASKNKFGLQVDDEAFKKAHTDALMNAFKHIGVGADIHMGQFDDSKYVQEVAREFAAQGAGEGQRQGATVSPPQAKPKAHSALQTAVRGFVHTMEGCGDWDEWCAFRDLAESQKLIADVQENLPHWWDGGPDMPAEFVPLRRRIEMLEANFANRIADIARV